MKAGEQTSTGPAGATTVALEGGRSLRVLSAGEGPPVVLIHGALGTAEDMQIALFDRLSPRFRVLAPDRPGHGFSVRETAPEGGEVVQPGRGEQVEAAERRGHGGGFTLSPGGGQPERS